MARIKLKQNPKKRYKKYEKVIKKVVLTPTEIVNVLPTSSCLHPVNTHFHQTPSCDRQIKGSPALVHDTSAIRMAVSSGEVDFTLFVH